MPNVRALLVACAIAGALGTTAGCAGRQRAVEVPDAALGRVIIYRNGVAYFERKAVVEGELTLNVPRERVDDFLKSLTVTDAKTGESLPISYPTRRQSGEWIQMRIALPPGRREVRLAYVTESPAWKPSYRVILDRTGKARLQSWAIVDNISGEAWEKVEVGVGSTSALSFRYDLHSVQVVQRETIDGATKIAQAPPKGGSPYGVDKGVVRVIGEVGDQEIANVPVGSAGRDFAQVVEVSPAASKDASGISLAGATAAESKYTVEGANVNNPSFGGTSFTYGGKTYGASGGGGRGRNRRAGKAAQRKPASRKAESRNIVTAKTPPPPPPSGLDRLSAQLQKNKQRVVVQGYALREDTDRPTAALRRANTVREALIARGIAADRIDVVGQADLAESPGKSVQVIAAETPTKPSQARTEDDGKPRGSAHFMAAGPMTIEAGHSAMVTLFDSQTDAERVYLYDPVSARGSKSFAFNAVRLDNPSDHTLDSGPITVYAKKRFLGEGLTEPIPPKSSAIVPFGLDKSIVVRPDLETTEEIESLQKIEHGIATTETQRIRTTRLEIANRGQRTAEVFVRHRVASGWSLKDPPKGLQRMRGDVLVPVTVGAGETVKLSLQESMPITTAIDLRSPKGLEAVEVYLKKGKVEGELEKDLEAVLAARRELADTASKLASRQEHLYGLRTRVNELTIQLVALRKVSRAQSLSGHLAKRARQLGNRLDKVAAEVTDLQTKHLKQRIELNNLVAELTLAG